MIILGASIISSIKQIGVIGRNNELVEDIHMILKIIPNKTTISIDENMRKNHSLKGYFARYAHVSVTHKKKLLYHISYEEAAGDKNYELTNLNTKVIFLYKEKDL